MKAHNRGSFGFLQDDQGNVRGIWVDDLEKHVQSGEEKFKIRLQSFLARLVADPSEKITSENISEIYAAIAQRRIRFQENDPNKGGGYWLVIADEPEKKKVDYKHWQCPKCGGVLEKGVGRRFKKVIGSATCGGCGAKFSPEDVYGGKYDVEIVDLGPPIKIIQVGWGLTQNASRKQDSKWWQFWKKVK